MLSFNFFSVPRGSIEVRPIWRVKSESSQNGPRNLVLNFQILDLTIFYSCLYRCTVYIYIYFFFCIYINTYIYIIICMHPNTPIISICTHIHTIYVSYIGQYAVPVTTRMISLTQNPVVLDFPRCQPAFARDPQAVRLLGLHEGIKS